MQDGTSFCGAAGTLRRIVFMKEVGSNVRATRGPRVYLVALLALVSLWIVVGPHEPQVEAVPRRRLVRQRTLVDERKFVETLMVIGVNGHESRRLGTV